MLVLCDCSVRLFCVTVPSSAVSLDGGKQAERRRRRQVVTQLVLHHCLLQQEEERQVSASLNSAPGNTHTEAVDQFVFNEQKHLKQEC